jgi:hypothetical protein
VNIIRNLKYRLFTSPSRTLGVISEKVHDYS